MSHTRIRIAPYNDSEELETAVGGAGDAVGDRGFAHDVVGTGSGWSAEKKLSTSRNWNDPPVAMVHTWKNEKNVEIDGRHNGKNAKKKQKCLSKR